MCLRRDRGADAARAGHGVAAPQSAQGDGVDRRGDRRTARLLLPHQGRDGAVPAVTAEPEPRREEMTMESHEDVRIAVRERYGTIAETGGCGCGTGGSTCCSSELDYTDAEKAAVPKGAILGLGCGAPVALAALKRGETVLDLGSGAGVDVFLAAREVGPEGRAIGVDMTPAMIDRARANAAKSGQENVEFRLGEIEHLPVPDGSVDAIVSNLSLIHISEP